MHEWTQITHEQMKMCQNQGLPTSKFPRNGNPIFPLHKVCHVKCTNGHKSHTNEWKCVKIKGCPRQNCTWTVRRIVFWPKCAMWMRVALFFFRSFVIGLECKYLGLGRISYVNSWSSRMKHDLWHMIYVKCGATRYPGLDRVSSYFVRKKYVPTLILTRKTRISSVIQATSRKKVWCN